MDVDSQMRAGQSRGKREEWGKQQGLGVGSNWINMAMVAGNPPRGPLASSILWKPQLPTKASGVINPRFVVKTLEAVGCGDACL